MLGSRLGRNSYDALTRFFRMPHASAKGLFAGRNEDESDTARNGDDDDWLTDDIDRDENVSICTADSDRTPDGVTRTNLARMLGGRLD